MTHLSVAKNGEPTAQVDSVHIHSAYNPDREALRFLKSQNIAMHGTAIIVGAGLGYVERAILNHYPSLRIIAFHLNTELYNNKISSNSAVLRWHPALGIDPTLFLLNHLKEPEVRSLQILEWAPAEKAMPELTAKVMNGVATVVRRYSGNINATVAFGQHWIRNTFQNYSTLSRILVPRSFHLPLVIAASGPSLESAFPSLKRNRTRYVLWALPSAVLPLQHAGLQPDLIITSDPGYWARLHSRNFPEQIPLAMPLCAAPFPTRSAPIMILVQNTPGETELLEDGCPTLRLPACGTVAATAIEAWKALSGNLLLLVGLDLCWNDLRSHARPHSFDGWLSLATRRTHPALTTAYERALAGAPERNKKNRTGPVLKTYTDWFRLNPPGKNAFRWTTPSFPVSVPLPGFTEIGESFFQNLPEQNEDKNVFETMEFSRSPKERKMNILNTIRTWKELVACEKSEKSELMYTLDPRGAMQSYLKPDEGNHRKTVLSILNRMEVCYAER